MSPGANCTLNLVLIELCLYSYFYCVRYCVSTVSQGRLLPSNARAMRRVRRWMAEYSEPRGSPGLAYYRAAARLPAPRSRPQATRRARPRGTRGATPSPARASRRARWGPRARAMAVTKSWLAKDGPRQCILSPAPQPPPHTHTPARVQRVLQIGVGGGVKAGCNVWTALRDVRDVHPTWEHLKDTPLTEADLPRWGDGARRELPFWLAPNGWARLPLLPHGPPITA